MVRMRITAILTMAVISIAAISGCTTQSPPILTPVPVEVPIATPVYCEAASLQKPALPIATLKAESPPADTLRAYAATVAVLKGAVQERDLVIAGCAAPVGNVESPATLELPAGAAPAARTSAK
jgi:hypothetical protein